MMKFQYILPERDPKRDIGWEWVRGAKMFHYYRSRPKSNMAFSHCGIVSDKKLFEKIENLPLCVYCEMIENMRDQRENGAIP